MLARNRRFKSRAEILLEYFQSTPSATPLEAQHCRREHRCRRGDLLQTRLIHVEARVPPAVKHKQRLPGANRLVMSAGYFAPVENTALIWIATSLRWLCQMFESLTIKQSSKFFLHPAFEHQPMGPRFDDEIVKVVIINKAEEVVKECSVHFDLVSQRAQAFWSRSLEDHPWSSSTLRGTSSACTCSAFTPSDSRLSQAHVSLRRR